MNIIDMSKCEFSPNHGTYGGQAGDKDGIVYQGSNWIVKYPKNTKDMHVDSNKLPYTTAPLSEYLGSHIYSILMFDVHETILGFRRNKIIVACKDFSSSRGKLLEIRTIKNASNEQLEEKLNIELHETGSSHSVNFNEILLHLKYNDILKQVDGICDRFWDQILIDGFIGNNDRNNGNWGVVLHGSKYELAPIFDNGGAFYSKLDEDQILSRLSSEDKINNIANSVTTVYSIEDHKLTLKEMFDNNYDGLNRSLLHNVPIIEDKLSDIFDLIDEVPEYYNGILVCSENRKEYYKRILETRFNKLILPAYAKLQVISKDRIRFDLLNHAQSQGKPVKDVITELAQLIPSTYNSEKYSHAVRAWITLQIQEGNVLSESDLIKLKELSNE